MIYLELFLSFLQVGLFSVGGGYAAMPDNPKQRCREIRLAHHERIHRLITIAEMTPGPLAINSATLCRGQDSGRCGRRCGYPRVHIALVRHCFAACSRLYEVQERFRCAECARQPAPRCGGSHSFGRADDTDKRRFCLGSDKRFKYPMAWAYSLCGGVLCAA